MSDLCHSITTTTSWKFFPNSTTSTFSRTNIKPEIPQPIKYTETMSRTSIIRAFSLLSFIDQAIRSLITLPTDQRSRNHDITIRYRSNQRCWRPQSSPSVLSSILLPLFSRYPQTLRAQTLYWLNRKIWRAELGGDTDALNAQPEVELFLVHRSSDTACVGLFFTTTNRLPQVNHHSLPQRHSDTSTYNAPSL